MRSKEDEDTAVTLDTAMEHPSSLKKRQRVIFKREEVRRSVFESPLVDPDETEQTRLWSRPVHIAFGMIAILVLVTRQPWLLQGISFVAIAYIALFLRKWAMYLSCDDDLKRAIRGMNSYFSLAMREAEKTIKGNKARRMLEGGALACRGTAQSFTIRFIRLRNEALLEQNKWELRTLHQQLERSRENWLKIREKVKMSF